MKLPANALIFLTALGVEFKVNFLNRCRVNALSGEQVRTASKWRYKSSDLPRESLKIFGSPFGKSLKCRRPVKRHVKL